MSFYFIPMLALNFDSMGNLSGSAVLRMNFLHNVTGLLDAGTLLAQFGPATLIGIAVVIFIESGVLFPFLPGDSLLVTAAILRHDLNISVPMLLAVAITAAFLGDQVGFFLGHTFGRKLFKPGAKILKTEYLDEAQDFFERRGPLALVLGRFVPVVRTYVPLAAGTAGMKYSRFIVWNVAGAVGWVVSMTLVGVLLGDIPGIAHRIDLIMIVIVAISVLPIAIKALSSRRSKRRQQAELTNSPVAPEGVTETANA